jgi:hypothetical protein
MKTLYEACFALLLDAYLRVFVPSDMICNPVDSESEWKIFQTKCLNQNLKFKFSL